MSITIEVAQFRNKPLLKVVGEIICQESIKLSQELQPFLSSSNGEIYIDLSGTSFIDSYGLGGLIYSQKLLERNNKQLVLLNPHTKVLEVLQRNNLHLVFKIEYSLAFE